MRVVAAVDLGASGGRVIAGCVDGDTVTLDVVHRFHNGLIEVDGHLRWNFDTLFNEMLTGLRLLSERYPEVESIGIDTWGVDYGALDADGRLLSAPIAYRDERTADVIGVVHALISPSDLYQISGLQQLPFNTIYQVAAEQRSSRWDRIAHIALLPDLIAFRLTGVLRTEYTNATTTGLVDVHTQNWSERLLDMLGIPQTMLPAIELPGATRGVLQSEIAEQINMRADVVVTTVGSHDTASAVVGVPAGSERFGYVASGTWSLVGLELGAPIATAAAHAANFTNEGGVDGTTRFLRNTGGLWLLQECLREWGRADLDALLHEASQHGASRTLIDADDPTFITSGNMPERIAAAAGLTTPSPATTTRLILDSLAAAYARTLHAAEELAGYRVDHLHVVGGGSQNTLLCQLTANTTRRCVIAGPTEATALGNVLVQARSVGAISGDLATLRELIHNSATLTTYEPK